MGSVFVGGYVNPYNQTPRGIRDDVDDGYIMEDEFCFYSNETDDCIFVHTDEAGRPDKIAYRAYSNPLFDWVIMRRNCILHPSEIIPGMMLYAPKYNNVIGRGSPLNP